MTNKKNEQSVDDQRKSQLDLESEYSLLQSHIQDLRIQINNHLFELMELDCCYRNNPLSVSYTKLQLLNKYIMSCQLELDACRFQLEQLDQINSENFSRPDGVISFQEKNKKLLQIIDELDEKINKSELTYSPNNYFYKHTKKLDRLLSDEQYLKIFITDDNYDLFLQEQQNILNIIIQSIHDQSIKTKHIGELNKDNFDIIKEGDVNFSNSISNFVCFDILNRSNQQEMIVAFTRWLHVISGLLKKRNYQAAFAVFNGLNLQAVYRLKFEQELTSVDIEMFQNYKHLFNVDGNLRNLRQIIELHEKKNETYISPFNLTIIQYNLYQENYKRLKHELESELTKLDQLQEITQTELTKISDQNQVIENLKEAIKKNRKRYEDFLQKTNFHNESLTSDVNLTVAHKDFQTELSKMVSKTEKETMDISFKVLPRGEKFVELTQKPLSRHKTLFQYEPQKRISQIKHPIRALVGAVVGFCIVKMILPVMLIVGAKALALKLAAAGAMFFGLKGKNQEGVGLDIISTQLGVDSNAEIDKDQLFKDDELYEHGKLLDSSPLPNTPRFQPKHQAFADEAVELAILQRPTNKK